MEDDSIGNRILPPKTKGRRGPRTNDPFTPEPPRFRNEDPRFSDRPERTPRFERGTRPERADRAEGQERFDRTDRPARAPRSDRPGRPERTPRPDQNEYTERPARRPRIERSPRPDSVERSPRPEQTERRVYRPRTDQAIPPVDPTLASDTDDAIAEGLPATPFAELDQTKLLAAATEAAETIVSSILGKTPVEVTLRENRVDVRVDCGDDSGLLIGREGQTLTALQYITSRIVSRAMEAPVRVQFDVGDYRERQDERLHELALNLAERVRATGRPCSTRPMSSYHRRLVHMALQDEPDIQTRSSGDGPLKRVIIQRRRPERNGK